MMHRIEDPKLRLPRGIQDLEHMRDAVIRFCNSPNTIPYFATLGNEVVVRINHKKCGELVVVYGFHHGLSPTIACRWRPRAQRLTSLNSSAIS